MRIVSGTLDITPEAGTELSGWADGTRLSTRVAHALEANFLAFETGRRLVVVVATDSLFGSSALEKHVGDALANRWPHLDVCVISAASHTHFAPALDRDKPLLGAPDNGWQRDVVTAIARSVELALVRGREEGVGAFAVSTVSAEVGLSTSRRRRWPWPVLSKRTLVRFPGIVMAPNRRAVIDQTARLSIIGNAIGKPIALLLNWAAHPTVYPMRDHISADYIAVVRQRLRDEFDDERLPILFLQGFAGDIRPLIAGAAAPGALQTLMRGPTFGRIGLPEWQRFADTLANEFVSFAIQGRRQMWSPLSEGIQVNTLTMPLEYMMEGDHCDRAMSLRRLAVGDQIDLMFVSAEPSSALVKVLHNYAPQAWPVGYAGDVFGYWPTSVQCAEGGYEAEGFFELFGLKGRFRGQNSEIFERMVAGVIADGEASKG